VLAASDGGWTFRLDVVKELSGDPPDDGTLLAGLADDRPRAQPSTLPYLDYLDRLAALEQALRANGQWWFPHPWLTTFVGDAAVEPVVAGELARLTPADLGPLGQVALSPSSGSRSPASCRGARRAPCSATGPPSGCPTPWSPPRT
jgi:cytokinin dehydrogenase